MSTLTLTPGPAAGTAHPAATLPAGQIFTQPFGAPLRPVQFATPASTAWPAESRITYLRGLWSRLGQRRRQANRPLRRGQAHALPDRARRAGCEQRTPDRRDRR